MESGIWIADKQEPNQYDLEGTRMMWTACLFAPDISASCYSAFLLCLLLRYDSLPETQRFDFYTKLMRSNPLNSEEILQQIEKQFELYLTFRKLKHKSQPQIVAIKKLEADILARFKACKDWYTELSASMKLAALLPLSVYKQRESDKPMVVYWMPPNNSPEHLHDIVNVYSGTFCDWQWLPLLHAGIRQLGSFADLNTVSTTSPGQVLCEPLFEFPEPLELTAGQLQIVRNDMSAQAWNLMDTLAFLNRELMEIAFQPDTISSVTALYKEKVQPLKANMQQAIDHNRLLTSLKNEKETKTVCRLWVAISSFDTLFGFYRQLDIIDATAEAYIKEQAAVKMPTGNARVFLFLENIDNA